MNDLPVPESLRATALAFLGARAAPEAAAALARARVEPLPGAESWTVDGRSVHAVRVALWLEAADRVLVESRHDVRDDLVQAVSSAIESPTTLLRELLILQARRAAPDPPPPALSGGYRDAPLPEPFSIPSGPTLARTASAYLEASGRPALASALARAVVALEPIGSAGASRVFVALDAADLAAVRRDPRHEPIVREAIEIAALGPAHRAVDVVLVLRAPATTDPPAGSTPEAHLIAAARRAGCAALPLDRTGDSAIVVLVTGGHLTIVEIDPEARDYEADGVRVDWVRIPASEVADDDSALRAIARVTRK